MKAKLPQMDFSRKFIQTSVSAAQGKMQETSVKSPQNFTPLEESSDAKVTSSHFSPSKGIDSSETVHPPPPPGNHQETFLAQEDLIAGPKMSTVRGFPSLSDFISLMEFSVFP